MSGDCAFQPVLLTNCLKLLSRRTMTGARVDADTSVGWEPDDTGSNAIISRFQNRKADNVEEIVTALRQR